MSKITDLLRNKSHWRCEEPILVIESDDWGLHRVPCDNLVSNYGQPLPWSKERFETEKDLQTLYTLLSDFKDPSGRPACITSNFIVSNPDFKAIEENGYQSFSDSPIYLHKLMLREWKDGINRKVFFPQYHGRAHYWIPTWMKDLSEDTPGARDLLRATAHQGLSLIKGQGWRYHSEYLDWNGIKRWTKEDLVNWVSTGLDYFERTFGYRSLSTIAPHYILPILAEEVLTKAGIRYIQGANQRIVQDSNGHKTVFRHSLGERGLNNSIYLTRTIKFEPFLGLSKTRILEVRDKIQRLWEASIPCVIDFHRINICSPWQDTAIESLHELLSSISHSNPLFLNSQELGEAISNKGIFTDSFYDTERKLTPSYPTPRHAIRYTLSRVHRAQLKSADY